MSSEKQKDVCRLALGLLDEFLDGAVGLREHMEEIVARKEQVDLNQVLVERVRVRPDAAVGLDPFAGLWVEVSELV